MKLTRIVPLALVAALVAGCASQPRLPAPLTPQQAVALACPAVQTVIAQFQAYAAVQQAGSALTKDGSKLAALQVQNDKLCAANAAVSPADLARFAQTVIPAAQELVATLPIPQPQMTEAEGALAAASIAIDAAQALAQQIHPAAPRT